MKGQITLKQIPELHIDGVNSLVGTLITELYDVASAWDIPTDYINDRLTEILNDHDLPYEDAKTKCSWCGNESDELYDLGHCQECGDDFGCFQDYERKDKYND